MIEVELKAWLRDKPAALARVSAFAEPLGPVDKRDAYWHGPDWRLHRGTKGFRVRAEGKTSVVTFKTKRSEGGIEINREREFSISDPEVFEEFALRLGCEPFYSKRKLGRAFRVRPGADRAGGPGAASSVAAGTAAPPGAGAATIEIVEVRGLGDFIEIEILLPEEDPAAVALARGEIMGLLARAGVPETDIEPRYYSELLLGSERAPAASP